MDEPNASIRPWSWWWILGSSFIVGLIYLAAQVAGVIAVGVFDAVTVPGFDFVQWAERADGDGFVLSVATIASAIVCIPVLRWLTGRRESAPWTFLGFRSVAWRDIVLACMTMAVFIAITDPLNVWLGRPLVPPFMQEAYATARVPALLFLAVAIVAPVTEELAFRGFLFGALRARAVPVGVVTATSLVFAVIHTQ
jgi:membrane protease YdiL (CAAX protease family)